MADVYYNSTGRFWTLSPIVDLNDITGNTAITQYFYTGDTQPTGTTPTLNVQATLGVSGLQ